MAVWSSRLVVERSRSISRRGGFSLFQTFGTFRFLDGRSKCATESYTHTHTHAHTLKGAERIEEETSERCLAKVCHHSTLFFSFKQNKKRSLKRKNYEFDSLFIPFRIPCSSQNSQYKELRKSYRIEMPSGLTRIPEDLNLRNLLKIDRKMMLCLMEILPSTAKTR